LLTRLELGDLIPGAQEVLQGDSKQTEMQGEYPLAVRLLAADLSIETSAIRILNSPKFLIGMSGSLLNTSSFL